MSEAEKPKVSDEEMLARFKRSTNRPRASDLMGFELIAVDQAAMRIECFFTAREDFTNPMGQVQGGFLTAMLDDAMSVAGLVASNITHVMPTLEMKTSFLRPAKPGRLRAVGHVLKWGKSIAFLEGELYDEQNRLLARATATAMPTPYANYKS